MAAEVNRIRLVSWNINGLASIPYPFNLTYVPTTPSATAEPSAKPVPSQPPLLVASLKELLDALSADIICFQEVKVTRHKFIAHSHIALVDGYDCAVALCRNKARNMAYSGVATYCKRNTATPVAAVEGLSHLYNSHSSPLNCPATLYHDIPADELRALDSEGRCIITDHGTFVLFNLYVPNCAEDRADFQMAYLRLLQRRVQTLRVAGRHVVIVGDMNVCHKLVDHCDPTYGGVQTVQQWKATPRRLWMDQFLQDEGMIDLYRHHHPLRTHAYTCWNTLTNARSSNYGSRIDYVISDAALVQRGVSVSSDILSHIAGSDHCPVTALFDRSKMADWIVADDAPSICTKHWSEFAGKQQTLSHFIIKAQSVQEHNEDTSGDVDDETTWTGAAPSGTSYTGFKRPLPPASLTSSMGADKKRSDVTTKRVKSCGGDSAFITSFFSKNKSPVRSLTSFMLTNNDVSPVKSRTSSPPVTPPPASPSPKSSSPTASFVSASALPSSPPPPSSWSALFPTTSRVITCTGHGLVCPLLTVNKKGVNHGKKFYTCPIPPPARCGYFAWLNDIVKQERKQQQERSPTRL